MKKLKLPSTPTSRMERARFILNHFKQHGWFLTHIAEWTGVDLSVIYRLDVEERKPTKRTLSKLERFYKKYQGITIR